ncbi:alpha/beta hydrolase [Cryptosporangium arvum]|uniref:alpha/beta hydrolase n=1 Tax=Cryptosporangium arvum TaxID=80871 RepID=UPI0004B0927F|nr:alpha/beta hydrolase [Cryptosporangium arvum]
MSDKAPLRARLVLRDTVEWDALTDAQVIAARGKINRLRASRVARVVTGRPDRGAWTADETIDLPGRRLRLRVHRGSGGRLPLHRSSGGRLPLHRGSGGRLPLVLSFHGGGFILGTPAQNDWLNSYLAARLPAVVVSVAYRLAPEHPLPAAVDDGYDTLVGLVADADRWGIDPGAVATFGESAGGTLAALVALRAGRPALRAQVLAYPSVDWTEKMADYPSVAANTGQPGLSVSEWLAARRLAVPRALDPRDVSPVKAPDVSASPPTLVVTGTLDPAGDHGSAYAERLRAEGVNARVARFPRAIHGFLSMPGLIPSARPARDEVLTFLRGALR